MHRKYPIIQDLGMLVKSYLLLYVHVFTPLGLNSLYLIVGKFGGGKVWQIDSFQAFGE